MDDLDIIACIKPLVVHCHKHDKAVLNKDVAMPVVVGVNVLDTQQLRHVCWHPAGKVHSYCQLLFKSCNLLKVLLHLVYTDSTLGNKGLSNS